MTDEQPTRPAGARYLPQQRRGEPRLPGRNEAQRVYKLAKRVARTGMVPGHLKGKTDAVMATMIAGMEIGLSPMEACRSFYVVDGRPSESAELLHTLALRAGHDVWVSKLGSREVVVSGRHLDWPEDRPALEVEWDLERAAEAGLVDVRCVDSWPRHGDQCDCKDNWRTYLRAMLRSRAISECVRSVCPEVTVGATYAPEELGVAVNGPGGVPEDAPTGFGALGPDFEVPHLEEIDAGWIASHTVDQVLAAVDHHGADIIIGPTGHTLAQWVLKCEEDGEDRPRLYDGLEVRMEPDVVEAVVVEDDGAPLGEEDTCPECDAGGGIHHDTCPTMEGHEVGGVPSPAPDEEPEDETDEEPDESPFLSPDERTRLLREAGEVGVESGHLWNRARQLADERDLPKPEGWDDIHSGLLTPLTGWIAAQAGEDPSPEPEPEQDTEDGEGEEDDGESASQGRTNRQILRARLRGATVSNQHLSTWISRTYEGDGVKQIADLTDEQVAELVRRTDEDVTGLVEEIKEVVHGGS